jgi:citrate synthase
MEALNCQLSPGLEGVPVAESGVSYVDGRKGILEYRGINVVELAKSSNFLETAYLLIWGKLPSDEEFRLFKEDIKYHRRIKYQIRDMMKCYPDSGHSMDALQTSAAALGLFYARRAPDNPADIYRAIYHILAKIPTMVAAFHQIKRGNDPVKPNDNLDYAANFLYMLTERVPSTLEAEVFDKCLILHAEHTINASTFSAMVTASTLTDPYGVIASAVGTLAGPLHGGANEEVLTMLEEIGSVDRVEEYINNKIEKKEKIMGFGHRVYKVKDPRATILQEQVVKLFHEKGEDEYYQVALAVEKMVEERLGTKGIYPNVDFYSGLVYRKLKIKPDLFTPIFAIARVAGWLAHWKEQIEANRIFRPTQIYKGEHQLEYIPMEDRN